MLCWPTTFPPQHKRGGQEEHTCRTSWPETPGSRGLVVSWSIKVTKWPTAWSLNYGYTVGDQPFISTRPFDRLPHLYDKNNWQAAPVQRLLLFEYQSGRRRRSKSRQSLYFTQWVSWKKNVNYMYPPAHRNRGTDDRQVSFFSLRHDCSSRGQSSSTTVIWVVDIHGPSMLDLGGCVSTGVGHSPMGM